MSLNITAILGVAGVNHLESRRALKVGHQFELLVLFALLAVFVQLLMEYSGQSFEKRWVSGVIWAVFALELVVNLSLVQYRLRYVRENWLNVIIVFVAFPWIDWGSDWALIIRSLRLILFLRFFAVFFKDVVTVLKRNRFGQILLAFAFIIVGAGAVFSYIEDRPFIDGVWYAIVTITTVGYGDVVPHTENGRLFGGVLILFGVLFFSLVSANIAAFLIGSEQKKLERDILHYMKKTDARLIAQTEKSDQHVERVMKHMSKEIEALKRALEQEKKR